MEPPGLVVSACGKGDSALISACGKGRQPQGALQSLLHLGLLPVITYSVAISACEKGRNTLPGAASVAGQAMLLRGLRPDVITYSAAISAGEKGRKPEQALPLRRQCCPEASCPT